MEIIFNINNVPYLDFRLILKKMWTLFEEISESIG